MGRKRRTKLEVKDMLKGQNFYITRTKSHYRTNYFLKNAKPPVGSPLYDLLEEEKQKREDKYSGAQGGDIIPLRNIDRVKFVDDYIKALQERYDLIPNIYQTRSYLLAHTELIPAEDVLGYRSFCKNSFSMFFIPAYKWFDDKVFFRIRESYFTSPLSIAPGKGLRLDVQYIYTRDVTLYAVSRIASYKDLYTTQPYKVYALPYTDKSKDELLYKFLDKYEPFKSKRACTDDLQGFKNMLFNHYGQCRYILETDDGIQAVIIWEDTGDMVHMLYTVGVVYKKYHDERNEPYIKYPEVLIRCEFMKCFPKGTLFNGGGCGFSKYMRTMQERSQPSHIFELRTFRAVVCPNKNKFPVGRLPYEPSYFSKGRCRGGMNRKNKVLFNPMDKNRIIAFQNKGVYDRELRFKQKRMLKFMKNRKKQLDK